MKKYVKAASSLWVQSTNFKDRIEAEAYRRGKCSVEWYPGENYFKCIPSDSLLPEIDVEVEDTGDMVEMHPSMMFKPITYSEIEFADSFEYYADKIAELAKFCTYLMKNPYYAYEDEDE